MCISYVLRRPQRPCPKLDTLAKELLPISGLYGNILLRPLAISLWWISGPLAYMITRRPGAAFLTYGWTALFTYMLQGGELSFWDIIPAVVMEGVFAIRAYKRYDYRTVVLATVLAEIGDLGVLFIRWSFPLRLDWIIPSLIGALLAGQIAYGIGRALGK